MPVAACYVCYAELKRCYKFMVKSTIAENTLIELLQSPTEISPKSVCTVDRKAKGLASSLTVTMVKHETFPHKPETPAVIKTEPLDQEDVDIKVEVDEVSYVENCGDESEGDDVPLECIKTEGNEGPSSSNAANSLEADDAQVSLPLEVNVEIKEETPHEGQSSSLTATPLHQLDFKCSLKCPANKPEKHDEETNTDTKNKLLKIRPGKSYECTICQKRFTQSSQLINHLRTHTGEKPFKCNLCDSKFSQASSLNRHLKAHTGEKPFQCDICERKFIQKSELQKHLRTHTGEKPYKCDVCGKSFSLNKHLTSHMRSHTGEKPFECTFCDAKYKERNHLVRHLRMHSGEKPFECNVCEHRFRRRCNLKTHLMIHSGERPHPCTLCEKTFIRSSHLKLHMSTHKD